MIWLILQNKIKNNWQYLLIIFIAIIFFGVMSRTVWMMNSDGLIKWLSPDENANYFFSKLFAETGSMLAMDSDNRIVEDIIHPRSFRSDLGELKPVSFLGIILIYGFIGRLFGVEVIPYLTPVFGAVGIIVYYLFIARIFSKRIALLSSVMLSFFPVYIYYTVRSMFHNILFTIFLIIGVYFLAQIYTQKSIFKDERSIVKRFISFNFHNINQLAIYALGGLFIGLALLTRTSELIWVGPMLVFLWLLNFKHIRITQIVIFISFLLLGYSPAFYYNQILYGSIWLGGYHEMNNSIVDISKVGTNIVSGHIFKKEQVMAGIEIIKSNVFYFGFKSVQSWQQFIDYFMIMFYWVFWPAVMGLGQTIDLWKTKENKEKKYLIVYILILLILMFYYGSWKFNDNPDVSQVTIGNSYTRYWLPIYLGALPFASMFFVRIAKLITSKKRKPLTGIGVNNYGVSDGYFFESVNSLEYRRSRIDGISEFFVKKVFNRDIKKGILESAVVVVLVSIVCFVSVGYVLKGSSEGLIETYYKHKLAKKDIGIVLAATPENSVIITRYHDKLIFPERRVIVGLFDDKNMVKNYEKLVNIAPVYYYNFTLPEKDFDYLNNRRLMEFNLRIEKVKEINAFSLYKLSSVLE